jgi:hypothetical protein
VGEPVLETLAVRLAVSEMEGETVGDDEVDVLGTREVVASADADALNEGEPLLARESDEAALLEELTLGAVVGVVDTV